MKCLNLAMTRILCLVGLSVSSSFVLGARPSSESWPQNGANWTCSSQNIPCIYTLNESSGANRDKIISQAVSSTARAMGVPVAILPEPFSFERGPAGNQIFFYPFSKESQRFNGKTALEIMTANLDMLDLAFADRSLKRTDRVRWKVQFIEHVQSGGTEKSFDLFSSFRNAETAERARYQVNGDHLQILLGDRQFNSWLMSWALSNAGNETKSIKEFVAELPNQTDLYRSSVGTIHEPIVPSNYANREKDKEGIEFSFYSTVQNQGAQEKPIIRLEKGWFKWGILKTRTEAELKLQSQLVHTIEIENLDVKTVSGAHTIILLERASEVASSKSKALISFSDNHSRIVRSYYVILSPEWIPAGTPTTSYCADTDINPETKDQPESKDSKCVEP